uniref:Leucine-rich repeat-containing N-terminal plant-type domain-containing protein n=1 Tax=Nelumbo nucifera TaxID=4432 RepID=A0A822XVR8_NELNU|nr:TPA_asm: hypothetical protein HUJ06_024642 [Nelumbo nucifera]
MVLLLLLLVVSLNQEGLYLQQVKLGFDDPDGALSDWNNRHDTLCEWSGIKCDLETYSVDLSNANIVGPFHTIICRLPNLTNLSLSNNYINSSLPDDISACEKLQHLDLSENYLVGPIPTMIANITTLRSLVLSRNNFSDDIPESFGRFQRLEELAPIGNLLNGTIPSVLVNFFTLRVLNLAYNPFTPSQIPSDIGNFTNLEFLCLTQSNLVSQIQVKFQRTCVPWGR